RAREASAEIGQRRAGFEIVQTSTGVVLAHEQARGVRRERQRVRLRRREYERIVVVERRLRPVDLVEDQLTAAACPHPQLAVDVERDETAVGRDLELVHARSVEAPRGSGGA